MNTSFEDKIGGWEGKIKRGRPKGPKKTLYRIRLTDEQKVKIAKFALDLTQEERRGSAPDRVGVIKGGRETERPTFEVAAERVLKEREVLMLRLALSERDDRIKELEGKAVVPVVVETEEVLLLRARVALLEKKVKEYETMYSS